LIATPTDHLELWRYRNFEQWPALVEWLRSHDTRFVCWNADFDIQAMLKLLPRDTNETLFRFTRVDYGRYRLRFVPGKFFMLGVKPNAKSKTSETLFTVYDLMQFYSTSLQRASEKVLQRRKTDPGVRWEKLNEVLRKGGPRAGRIRDYCRNDALLVEDIYKKSHEQFAQAGIDFSKPVSCASVAMQKFSGAMRHRVPRSINNIFEKTYRGGRIECLKLGYFPKAYLYDIHSAYPSAMAELPSTKGVWLPVPKTGLDPFCSYAAIRVQINVPLDAYRCPVPVLGDTQLMYPRGEWSQWVDLETYRVLQEQGMVQKLIKGWQLIGKGYEERPFKELASMYEERQRHPEQSWALKVIMNSVYGKVAQRMRKWVRTSFVGGNTGAEFWRGELWRKRETWTKSTNFCYASAITAKIRRRLFQEVGPSNVIFYATDGLMCSKPVILTPSGSQLGAWSEAEEVRDLVVVGSGVYTYKQMDGAVRTKVRGFEVGLNLYELLDRRRRILTLTVKRNWTLAQVMRQHKYPMFNELVDVPRYLDVCFDRKRIWESDRVGRDLLFRSFDSKPWIHYPGVTYNEFD